MTIHSEVTTETRVSEKELMGTVVDLEATTEELRATVIDLVKKTVEEELGD